MFGKKALSFICAFSVLGLVARPAAAEVHVTINPGGRVTVSAKNATVGQILAEWARVGQTKIVNPERAGGGVLTIELTNVPEVEAIEIILRSAGGYVLAPRRAEMANASLYDRILILPQSSPVSAARPAAAATLPQPRPGVPTPPRPFAPPLPGQIAAPQTAQDDNDDPADRPAAAAPPAVRPPVFNTFPQAAPQRTDPPAPPAPTSSVTMPVGVAVPGMMVPTPQPAGQPGVVAPPPQQQPR